MNILCIAASDNTGGAGVQADLKTCVALGSYPMTVVTALTAQDQNGIHEVWCPGKSVIEAQFEACINYANPDAIKIGLLPDADAIEALSLLLKTYGDIPIVLDPVLGATCGGKFMKESEEKKNFIINLSEKLFPLSTYITPNQEELHTIGTYLFGRGFTKEQYIKLILKNYKPDHIIVTGGDSLGSKTVDELFFRDGRETVRFENEKVNSFHTHGTGCTFSTALANFIAQGYDAKDSVEKAKLFTLQAIKKGILASINDKYGPVIQ